MPDYREAVAEPAALSARLGARAELDRPEGYLTGQYQRLGALVERAHMIANGLSQLGDRAFGEEPPRNSKGEDVRQSPPYGGAMAEMHWTIDRMEDALNKLGSFAQRLEPLA